MAEQEFLDYVIDTTGAIRVMQYSWTDSPFSERVLCPIINQKETCVCYGLTVSEATRAIINLKLDCNIPKLSAQEVINNCHGKYCKGYQASIALEWVVKEGLAEDSAMPLDLTMKPRKGKAKCEARHNITDWEPIPNSEGHIKNAVLRQLAIVSLKCDDFFFSGYTGGLIDAYIMRQNPGNCHSMILCGYGFYIFPDKSIKNFWQLKNSSGVTSGENGYAYVLRNSSQPLHKWVALDPLVPLCNAPGEIYISQHLVQEMTWDELDQVVENPNLDVIVLFYASDNETQILRDFERVSRFYLTEKDNVKFIKVQVDVRADKRRYQRYTPYGKKFETFPALRIYKFKETRGKVGVRKLAHDGYTLMNTKFDFLKLAEFLKVNHKGEEHCYNEFGARKCV